MVKKEIMKTVGIIGGLGPETTAKFYLEVLSSCFKTNKINRPPMLIFNVPMHFDLEKEIIVEAKGKNRLLPFLIDAARSLEKGGADFIVIPCNTAHIFIEEVRQSVKIPVLSIVDESIKFLASEKVRKTGILATNQTIRSKLFNEKCSIDGIEICFPKKSHQIAVANIISKIINGRETFKDRGRLHKIVDCFENIDCLLLACTDLQLLIKNHNKIRIFDTMKILAETTAREILKEN